MAQPTKKTIMETLDAEAVEYDPTTLRDELEELLAEVLEDGAEISEIARREAAAPQCNSCGRSRLDGHVHQGV